MKQYARQTKLYKEINAKLVALYDALEDFQGELNFNSSLRFSKIDELKRKTFEEISQMLDQHTTWLFAFLGGLFIYAHNNHMKSLIKDAPKLDRWDLDSQFIDMYITESELQNDYINEINHEYSIIGERNSHAKLLQDMNVIADGIIYNQMEQRKVNKLIQKAVKQYTNREKRIIDTEGHRIVELAHYESANRLEREGYNVGKEWQTMRDDRVRWNMDEASHVAMQGRRQLLNQAYLLVPFGQTQHPGASGIANQDINCRCWNKYYIID